MYDDRRAFVPMVVLRPFTIPICIKGFIPMLPHNTRVAEFEMNEDGTEPKISGWMDYDAPCAARRFEIYDNDDPRSERFKTYLGTLQVGGVSKHLYEEYDMIVDDISEEDFRAYEKLRISGITNMMSSDVQRLAGISRETHVLIIGGYGDLCQKWPAIRDLELYNA